MDKAAAVRSFLQRVGELPHLPLITDGEMALLYGDEVIAAMRGLEQAAAHRNLCATCQSRCCQAVRCELYAPQFSRCPIHHLRPPVCRLHYCHRFFDDGDALLKDLSDIFFDGLLAAGAAKSDKVRLFDCPPLANCCPELVEATAEWMKAVQQGALAPDKGLKLIEAEAQRFGTLR
jgi:hypothetical protein